MRRSRFVENVALQHADFCPECGRRIKTGDCHCIILSNARKQYPDIEMTEISDNMTLFSMKTPPAGMTQEELEEARRIISRQMQNNE